MSKPINKSMIGLFCGGGDRPACCGDRGPGLRKAVQSDHSLCDGLRRVGQRLNVGSPVVFRGVKLGSVSNIRMQFNYATKTFTILVYSDFEPSQIQVTNMDEATAKKITAGKSGLETGIRT